MADAARARPGGRTARVRAAVLQATVAEIGERGYGALTVEAVAARSGVNKATLYRRWRGKDGLVVDAVETFGADQVDVPDTGGIDEDLRLWARCLQATLAGPVSGALVRAVLGDAGGSPLVQDLRRRFWLVRSALVVPVVERGIARRQLPPDTDAAEVVRAVGAPLYYRTLVLGESPTPELADLAARAALTAARAGVFAIVNAPVAR